jgi:hypothetical protein
MTEDLQMRQISGPPLYTSRTGKPVDHITLRTAAGELMGYIYCNDEDDAAGWQAQAGASPTAQNHAAFWIGILADSKKRGLKPGAALDQMLRTTHPGSYIVPGSRKTSANRAALAELAGHDPAPRTGDAEEQ